MWFKSLHGESLPCGLFVRSKVGCSPKAGKKVLSKCTRQESVECSILQPLRKARFLTMYAFQTVGSILEMVFANRHGQGREGFLLLFLKTDSFCTAPS